MIRDIERDKAVVHGRVDALRFLYKRDQDTLRGIREQVEAMLATCAQDATSTDKRLRVVELNLARLNGMLDTLVFTP